MRTIELVVIAVVTTLANKLDEKVFIISVTYVVILKKFSFGDNFKNL